MRNDNIIFGGHYSYGSYSHSSGYHYRHDEFYLFRCWRGYRQPSSHDSSIFTLCTCISGQYRNCRNSTRSGCWGNGGGSHGLGLSTVKKLASLFVALFSLVWLTGAGWLPLAKSGAAVYTGPGDVYGTAIAWWGLRAFSTADRGSRLINICDPSNVTCADWSSSASTGLLVVGTNPLNGT